MSLTYKVASLDDVDETLRNLYEEKDGEFVLKVAGLPEVEDVSGLKANYAKLLDEKKKQTAKLAEEQAEKDRLAEEAARKTGDIATLEASWQAKFQEREAQLLAESKANQDKVLKLTTGAAAERLAQKLAVQGSSDVLLPHIKHRLYLKEDGSVGVLDSQGGLSAATIEDLEKEFRTNAAFKPLLAADCGSGGGATGGFGGGAVKKREDYTEQEMREMLDREPAKFKQIFSK
ncbi:MAG: hypothetical protein RSE18_12000 [Acinetobacter sp.]